jgi:prepilin-type N-terminal cleavage/methylation domain-containing protein
MKKLQPTTYNLKPERKDSRANTRGFTLIETMVALSILVVSVAAPMSLAVKSLSSAFYARDQVTAFHLAQEAIESIRVVRDSNALRTVQGTPVDLLAGIPSTNGAAFTVDTRDNTMTLCPSNLCEPLKNNGEFYGHGVGSNWEVTRFTRTVTANKVAGSDDEIKVSVEVRWKSGTFQERAFSISENLYRWVNDGT